MRSVSRTIAVIDVGTNSTKLLVARVPQNGGIEVLRFARETTRIGRSMGPRSRITRAGLDATVEALERFARLSRRHRPDGIFAFSTFALRNASNAQGAVRAIRRRTGLNVRVLGGREEARFAYLSARRLLARAKPLIMVVDVGGGSTECVVARAGGVVAARSLPLGALHLTEAYLRSDPVATDEYDAMVRRIGATIRPVFRRFSAFDPSSLDLVVSGGSATTVAAMASSLAPGHASGERVTRAQLRELERACRSRTIAERRRLPGLPPDRADIILAGIAVVLAFVEGARKRTLRVNAGGVREGVLIHLARNNLRW
jgi:exopolyphosphatase/guanosine-5'-triphosphate,3'-diphosphate pyrophosphatase